MISTYQTTGCPKSENHNITFSNFTSCSPDKLPFNYIFFYSSCTIQFFNNFAQRLALNTVLSRFDPLKIPLCYRGADKSLARPGSKQARKKVRDARNFNNIETRAIKFFFSLQDKAPKEIHAILTETLACSLPDRAKDLSAPRISLF